MLHNLASAEWNTLCGTFLSITSPYTWVSHHYQHYCLDQICFLQICMLNVKVLRTKRWNLCVLSSFHKVTGLVGPKQITNKQKSLLVGCKCHLLFFWSINAMSTMAYSSSETPIAVVILPSSGHMQGQHPPNGMSRGWHFSNVLPGRSFTTSPVTFVMASLVLSLSYPITFQSINSEC